jgi:hypothetical protein
MPSSSYYRKQAELCARLALASVNDPSLMERYSALALDYLEKADEAALGPMPPPESPLRQRGSGMDHD